MCSNPELPDVEKSSDSVPEMFMCPVSRELMKDPVVLVDTGQIYDRTSITEWFRMGNNTCPLTGMRLSSQRLTPLYSIRNAVQDYASRKGIELGIVGEPGKDGASDGGPGNDRYGPLDDPGHCLSVVTSHGVSAYDVVALSRLVAERTLPQSYAALVLLREMTRHIDGSQLKKVRKELHMETIRELIQDSRLKIPAARLLVQIKGLLKISELINLLKMEDSDLRREILQIVRTYAYRHRGKMMEVADAVESHGVESILAITNPLVTDPSMESLSSRALDGAALIIASLAFRARHRLLVADRCIPGLTRHWRRTEDPGVKYPIAKAIQYLCEDVRGRTIAVAEGVVAEFARMLPPVNHEVDYSDFVFDDFFAFVTVPDTALKALYYLSQNTTALKQMVEGGIVGAVRDMISTTQLSDDTKSKYAKKLLDVLSNSPEFRLRRLMTLYQTSAN